MFIIIFFICCFLILFFLGLFSSLKIKRIEHCIDVSKKTSNFQQIKIVFFTDLHDSLFSNFNKRYLKLVNFIKNEKPDLIVFGGDLKTKKVINSKKFDLIFNQKYSTSNCYAIAGNHDYSNSKNLTLYHKSHFQLMINSSLNLNNCVFHFLDDLKHGQIIEKAINSNQINILFTHNPDTVNTLKYKYDLIIAGHTHGGQGKILKFRPMLKFVTKFPTVFNTEQIINTMCGPLIISPGIGSHFNLRYGVNPAYNVIILK